MRRRRSTSRQNARAGGPIRTCVGCRQRDRRDELVRVVRRAGAVALDRRGGAPGRGAYLHRRATCLDAFTRASGFVRSLRCVVPKAERAALRTGFPEVQA